DWRSLEAQLPVLDPGDVEKIAHETCHMTGLPLQDRQRTARSVVGGGDQGETAGDGTQRIAKLVPQAGKKRFPVAILGEQLLVDSREGVVLLPALDQIGSLSSDQRTQLPVPLRERVRRFEINREKSQEFLVPTDERHALHGAIPGAADGVAGVA